MIILITLIVIIFVNINLVIYILIIKFSITLKFNIINKCIEMIERTHAFIKFK